jgi:hypothetical protein
VRGLAVRPDQRTPTPGALLRELGQPDARRRYDEAAVHDLVRRASELEATAPTVDGSMTIGGVERLAAEVGIDPARVREAVALAAAPPPAEAAPSAWTRVIGGPMRLSIERLVPGEVPVDEFPTLVDEVRRTLGDVGMASILGRSVTWTAVRGTSASRQIQVSVSVRAGNTRIHVQDSLGDLRAGVFGGVLGGVGGGGLGPIIAVTMETLQAPAVLIAAVPLWIAAVFSGARSIYYYNTRSRQRQLEGLADRLAALARQLAPASLPSAPERGRLA